MCVVSFKTFPSFPLYSSNEICRECPLLHILRNTVHSRVDAPQRLSPYRQDDSALRISRDNVIHTTTGYSIRPDLHALALLHTHHKRKRKAQTTWVVTLLSEAKHRQKTVSTQVLWALSSHKYTIV